jgi:hypothetical protein
MGAQSDGPARASPAADAAHVGRSSADGKISELERSSLALGGHQVRQQDQRHGNRLGPRAHLLKTFEAEYQPPQRGVAYGEIRINDPSAEEEDARAFERLWLCAAYELHNIELLTVIWPRK